MLADLLGHATGDAGQERRRRHLGGLGAHRQSVSRRRKLVRQPLQPASAQTNDILAR
jgi:hypothetical protein